MKKGLTLIELIVYLGIIAIVLVVMIDLVTHLVFSQSKNVQSSEVQQNLRYAVERMTDSITNASSLNGVYPSNNSDLTVSGQSVKYLLNGDVLEIQEQTNPAVPITSSKVKILPPEGGNIFTKQVNGSAVTVKIDLIVQLTSDQNTKERATTTILLRGK